MPASAYLSIFDDWHLLPAAIASIAPRVDEIVVVDGAYAWMAPVLTAMGRDPTRSDPRVVEALAPYARKLRWINQVWSSETDKRAAGYAACRHRYIYRVDADEILFFDEGAVQRFLASGRAVAEMEMPMAVTPGLIRTWPGRRIERQALLFDRERIGPWDHLAYLWLVLAQEERARIGQPEPAVIGPDPIAFNAHLTHWRSPESAVSRARFYVLHAMRQGGPAPIAPTFRYSDDAGFTSLLQAVPEVALTQWLLGHSIVAGAPALEGGILAAMPLKPDAQSNLAPLYERFLDSLAALNADLAREPRAIASGSPVHIDFSTPASIAPLHATGAIRLLASSPLAAASVELVSLLPEPPWETVVTLPYEIAGAEVSFTLPTYAAAIRRTLRLSVWPQDGAAGLTLCVGR